jgi:hypothetical protein
VDEPPIHREEVVGLLFAVHDISQTLIRIEELLALARKAQAELDRRKAREERGS